MKKSKWLMVKGQWYTEFPLAVNCQLSSFFCSRILVFGLLLFSIFSSLNLYAQKITATVDRDKILIGEQVELKVLVTDVDKNQNKVSQWFSLPDSFNHFEIIKRLPVDTIAVEGSINYSQKIILTSFDSGKWQIPVIDIAFTNKQIIHSDSIEISVLPVDVSSLKDYHDFKEIVDVKAETDWLFIGAVVAGLIVSAILIYGLFRYWKKRKSPSKKSVKQLGIKEALEQLEILQQKGLIEKNKHKLYFTELILICRNFSDTQLQMFSADKTTDEYMLLIKNKVGNETTQTKFFQLLRLSDAVKFAKFMPSKTDCEEAMADAKKFIQTIYDFQFSKKN
jgi:hypothetical protein